MYGLQRVVPLSRISARGLSTSCTHHDVHMRIRDFERHRSSLGKKHKVVKNKGDLAEELQSQAHHEDFNPNGATFEQQMQSLAQKGFRRPYKGYQPPSDIKQKFSTVVDSFHSEKGSLSGRNKVELLNALSQAFQHRVPNSLVHLMTTKEQLYEFYSTPVEARTEYERLATSSQRPPNLHVQVDPLRFDPEQSTARGETGPLSTITAYPRSSTILTTPEAKKRYGKGYKAKHSPWVNVPEKNQDDKMD